MKSRYLQQGMYAAVFTVAAAQVNAASPVDFSSLVEQVSPAVVSVNVVKKMTQEELLQQQVPEILRRFFGNQVIVPQQQGPQEKTAYGSAFFISKDGYLLTNRHVIDDASRITITLNDRRELDATLVGSDERTDIALLKVNGASFPELRIGDSNQLKVGEPVLAIGSPFGFDYSASAGIVSAKSRNMSGETSVPFIQTDAALNPGNSGGPLFNQRGEVVGVNSRIFSGTGGYMGLSFSIPIDVAMDVVQQLKTNGKVTRSYLGVMLQDIDRNLADAYKLPKPEGSLINQVSPKSPAEKAGLKPGDVILKLDGNSISRTSDLIYRLNRIAPNQTIQLEVLRDDKIRTIAATLSVAPDDTPAAEDKNNPTNGLGMNIRDLTEAEQSRLNVNGGTLVREVKRGGLASLSNLVAGDVIVQVNSTPVPNSQAFAKAIAALPKNSVARIVIIRQGQRAIVGLRLQ
ncbi:MULTISPECIES: Do family serine endopeptidase [unclassified Acinetobacter]|uniref:Do family serine endopeptidase n=1 Tax=unclassified Acinetobacter TaxID=196816 RepID=UPI00244A1F51|nr:MULTISPECIES: Do family serine endopeptidase [unclassified Acinetobacter]MDH0031308.1 Do family serine endopeptidase [Acinetobacter sp. GD04021]MDH0887053.1 Do family serine endopeptidase [Acinetobacter sp. GD03873]MDH1083504.1 Do family serine endopeptidase [Acinetobacter sp. GD03983]MDH2190369.1 Do family serine endopeptidase [Acinetobacter sp. GD03645]MDH2203688.1 Do family serine endopeptidase [Acinetobacter sp. GD03647]